MKITINGKQYEAEYGETILKVAQRSGIYIPTLCHSDALPAQGSCRLCIVEVIQNNRSKVVVSCVYPIIREIEVLTHSKKIIKMRKTIIKLLYRKAPENKKINELREEYNIPKEEFGFVKTRLCLVCGLCVKACHKLGTGAIFTVDRGIDKKISTPYDESSEACIGCGACAYVCPTNAIKIVEKDEKRIIWNKTFDMLKCSVCGEYFATKEEYEYARKKSEQELGDAICDKCRKKVNADKLKNIFEDVDYQYLK